jgi:KaiC/GvpD/RAD55 family RecA-like ATPase
MSQPVRVPDGRDRPALRLESGAPAPMPDATELADEQIIAARQRLYEDTSRYPQFPWGSLAKLSGPMCPQDLVMVAARTGGGKSLFLQNLFDALIEDGRSGTYIGLEQSPDVLRIKWACLRQDVAPKLVLAPRPDEIGGVDHALALEKVEADLAWQRSQGVRERAHFAAARMINAAGLVKWTTWAIDHGATFVIVDHIDRVHHGDGRNAFHEMSQTVRVAKELAAKHRITMIVASQVGRPGDALEAFMPPSLHALRGGGTKEEEADTVLGIYRPL